MNESVFNEIKPFLKNISYTEYIEALVRSRYDFPDTIRCEVDKYTLIYCANKYSEIEDCQVYPGLADYVGGSDY